MLPLRFEMDCDASISHFHADMEILYVLSGVATVVMENRSFSLRPEDFVVINPYEHHELVKESGNHTLSVYIPLALVRETGLGMIRCCSVLQREQADYFPLIRAKLAMLYRNSRDEAGNRELYVQSDVYELLAVLREQFSAQEPANGALVCEDAMRRLLMFTEEHFSEPITVQDAAAAMFLSRCYMSKLFQRQMGRSYADYLQGLRLNKAVRLLIASDLSVTEVAMECGFSTVNTFIVNFQRRYGQTPGAYRRHAALEQAPAADTGEIPALVMTNLLKHTHYEERFHPLSKRPQPPVTVEVNASDSGRHINLRHNDSISVGWAAMLMQEGMRNAVRRAVREIGFRHVVLLGMLDDAMGVYYEMQDGEPALSFTYLDMVLDFVLSTGAKPSPILCYTPSALLGEAYSVFGSSYFAIPKDLDKWDYLVEGVLEHLVERYGVEELNQWRFPVYPGAYIDFGDFAFEEYYPFYRRMYAIIRSILPSAVILGCQLDLDAADAYEYDILRRFLRAAKRDNCLPDVLTFQFFHLQYQGVSMDRVRTRSTAPAEKEQGEIAPRSDDPDRLAHLVARVREVMSEVEVEPLPIQMLMWNSTMWQADSVNDTCFKSAFIVKNCLENMDDKLLLTYSALTDNNERRVLNSVSFHGGFGLMTYQGLPKAGYWAMTLLDKLGSVALCRGDGYLVTRSEDGKKIRICLYNDALYDPESHIDYPLTPVELCTIDRYYGFDHQGVRGFRIRISGLKEGRYAKETYSINRAHGSAYDNWMTIGSPMVISQAQQDYLEKTSIPGYQFEPIRVKENGELLLSTVLDALEVQVICLAKR